MAKQATGADVVNDARRYLGIRYVFGGGPDNPRAGLDCSGLVERVAFDLGISSCPRTSEQQWLWSEHVSAPSAGDLVFFVGADGEPGNPGHVGIVVEPGMMINAPHTGTVVQQESYSTNGTGVNALVGYGRLAGVVTSATANPNIGTSPMKSQNTLAAGAGMVVGGIVMLGIVILLAAALIFGVILLAKAS